MQTGEQQAEEKEGKEKEKRGDQSKVYEQGPAKGEEGDRIEGEEEKEKEEQEQEEENKKMRMKRNTCMRKIEEEEEEGEQEAVAQAEICDWCFFRLSRKISFSFSEMGPSIKYVTHLGPPDFQQAQYKNPGQKSPV